MHRFIPIRKLSSMKKQSAAEIRQTFIDYFVKDNSHSFIKSSAVIPYGDPSVAFVNAGMNQFKSVLLGVKPPPVLRAANSQKCIRVGGKHNDLEAVGTDGTHHTFFEMLGNWSFGDYFKSEACSLAWKLLIGPLRLDPKQLVVTYFGGDEKSGLSPDLECVDVWRNLGLKDSQLIPCDMKDNFWEMGPVGPCGPCTEIHLKHDGGMLELWNLVFIQYERRNDGTLVPLDTYHVDTGMGLERITKVLQKVDTNYDTDLFMPLFSLISKSSRSPSYSGKFGAGSELDCAYRVLADHSRAVSIALADGMFPDQNHKLRRLLRKCLLISEENFNLPGPQLLSDLIQLNSETLGQVYPELIQSLQRCQHLISSESETFNQSRAQARQEWQRCVKSRPELATLSGDHPGLIAALDELKGKKEISGETAFKLYDTYGLETNTIQNISEILKIALDLTGMEKCIENQQAGSRVIIPSEERILKSLDITPTADKFKYSWTLEDDNYIFPRDFKCSIVAIISPKNQIVSSVKAGDKCKIVLDKTCLYSESGGQVADKGDIKTEFGKGRIENVQKTGDYIIHHTTVLEGEIKTQDLSTLKLDSTLRLGAMQHHTATHLLNSALHKLLPTTYQRSSHVTPNYFTFDFTINKDKLNTSDIKYLEEFVNKYIKLELNINRNEIPITEIPNNTILVPGENYPEEITILKITNNNNNEDISLEACCGTHCNNTKHIVDFCIVGEKSSGLSVRSIRALAGTNAVLAKLQVFKLNQELNQLIIIWSKGGNISNDFMIQLQDYKNRFTKIDLPLLERQNLSKKLEDLEKQVTETHRKAAKSQVENEMTSLLSQCQSSYIIHGMKGKSFEPLPLIKANAMCLPQRASFIFSLDSDHFLRGRCTVPEYLISDTVTAEKWVKYVLPSLKATAAAIKSQDPKLVFSIKPKKISKEKHEEIISLAVLQAKNFLHALKLS